MREFANNQEDLIRKWNDSLLHQPTIHLIHTHDKRSPNFESFCGQFFRLAPKVHVVTQEGEEEDSPALLIGQSWRYYLIPLENELEPFLELLSMIEGLPPKMPPPLKTALEHISYPTHIRTYVTTHCPYCPAEVRKINPLPLLNKLIQISVIDGLLFPEMAETFKIQSVPTVILEDKFRWTGPIRLEEILEVIVHRDPLQLSTDTLERMIKGGDAELVAQMIIEKNRIFPSLLDLLCHSKWSIRLGAMVVLERIGEKKPDLVKDALNLIWRRMDRLEDRVKGDMIYLIGELGDREWISRLENLPLSEYHKDIQEVFKEAIETLRTRLMGRDNKP